MSRRHLVLSATAVGVGLLVLSACGQGAGTDGADTNGAGKALVRAAQQAEEAKLIAVENDDLGQVLTDQDGFTLYRFDEDTAEPAKSNCDGDCAEKWPPMLAEGDVQVDGVDPQLVGSVIRTDGTKQVTVGGWPTYRFAKDTAAGQTNGQGVGDTWYAVTPNGAKAGQDTEAQETSLVATELPGFGPALTDQDGFTLYLFTKDSKEPSKSNCDGDCAEQWPPMLAEDNLQIDGVDPNLVGTVTRTDGTEQVTVGGWPVYQFAKDTAPGQTNGHGVGDVWFVIEPAGCKSTAPVQQNDDGY